MGAGEGEFTVQHISLSYSPEAFGNPRDVIVPAALQNGYWRGEVRLKTRQGAEIPACIRWSRIAIGPGT